MIGDSIEIKIIDIRRGERGDRVRIGISAPQNIAVHRREVYDAIELEKRLIAEVADARESINQAGESL
jgi:carbon storage regulator